MACWSYVDRSCVFHDVEWGKLREWGVLGTDMILVQYVLLCVLLCCRDDEDKPGRMCFMFCGQNILFCVENVLFCVENVLFCMFCVENVLFCMFCVENVLFCGQNILLCRHGECSAVWRIFCSVWNMFCFGRMFCVVLWNNSQLCHTEQEFSTHNTIFPRMCPTYCSVVHWNDSGSKCLAWFKFKRHDSFPHHLQGSIFTISFETVCSQDFWSKPIRFPPKFPVLFWYGKLGRESKSRLVFWP